MKVLEVTVRPGTIHKTRGKKEWRLDIKTSPSIPKGMILTTVTPSGASLEQIKVAAILCIRRYLHTDVSPDDIFVKRNCCVVSW